MKQFLKISFASLLAISFCALSSCKDKDANEAIEVTESTDTVMTTEPDTTASPAPINDTNASGTTSGEMEQVP